MSRFGLRVGVVILPDLPWSSARDVWGRAEELGFDHAWTYDHLTWRGHRDTTWFAAVPTLTAASVVTTHLRLGFLVASPNFRHPLTFAKELVALDDISSGRITAGIGAGGTGWDATMLGQDPWTATERAQRFQEFVELTDQLLCQPTLTYTGDFWAVDEARNYPGCVQQPRVPLAIAATGPRGMRVAARHAQTWVTTGRPEHDLVPSLQQGVDAVAAQIDRLANACAREGRDLATLDRLVLTGVPLDSGLDSVDAFTETAGRYASVGVTDLVVHWPRATEPYRTDPATFERIFTA